MKENEDKRNTISINIKRIFWKISVSIESTELETIELVFIAEDLIKRLKRQ